MGACSNVSQTLFSPRACLYHSLMLLRVDLRVRSNVKRMATASLHTRGNMLTNSFWPNSDDVRRIHSFFRWWWVCLPPRSHMLKVISVFRITTDRSIKLTPRTFVSWSCVAGVQSDDDVDDDDANLMFGYTLNWSPLRRTWPSNSFFQCLCRQLFPSL